MQKIHTQIYKSPIGELFLGSYDKKLCLCDWRYRKMRERIDNRLQHFLDAEMEARASRIVEKTITQLEEYFEGKRKVFDVPLLLAGSEFQQRIWSELVKIPFGVTTTYKALSETIGNANAVRAVANANGANAISLLVPCHRVVGSHGELTGYAGGLRAKAKLLELELATFQPQNSPVQGSLNLT